MKWQWMLSFLNTPAQSSYLAKHYDRTWRWPRGSLTAKQAVFLVYSQFVVRKERDNAARKLNRGIKPRKRWAFFSCPSLIVFSFEWLHPETRTKNTPNTPPASEAYWNDNDSSISSFPGVPPQVGLISEAYLSCACGMALSVLYWTWRSARCTPEKTGPTNSLLHKCSRWVSH